MQGIGPGEIDKAPMNLGRATHFSLLKEEIKSGNELTGLYCLCHRPCKIFDLEMVALRGVYSDAFI